MPPSIAERHRRAGRKIAYLQKILGVRDVQIKVLMRWIRERDETIETLKQSEAHQ